MPVSISHHEGIYFPHLRQGTRGAAETGQLGSRTVRRGATGAIMLSGVQNPKFRNVLQNNARKIVGQLLN